MKFTTAIGILMLVLAFIGIALSIFKKPMDWKQWPEARKETLIFSVILEALGWFLILAS